MGVRSPISVSLYCVVSLLIGFGDTAVNDRAEFAQVALIRNLPQRLHFS